MTEDGGRRTLPPPVKLKLRVNFQSLALYPQRKTHNALSLPRRRPWLIEDIGAAAFIVRAAKSSAITRRYDARRGNRAR